MNKKGQLGGILNIYTFFFIIGVILVLGLFAVLSGSVINYVGDNVLPPIQQQTTDLAGQTAGDAVGVLVTANDAIPWIVGVAYVLSLVFILVLAYAFRISGEKYLLVLYFGLSVLIILLSIITSNLYQDFYQDGGDLGTELKAMGLMSYLLLYSPMIFSVLLTIGAIIIFSGIREDNLL